MKNFSILVLAFLFGTVISSCGGGKSTDASATKQVASQNLSEGSIFPEIMYKTIDGEMLKTQELKGKIVFYNFSFALCQPCIAQKEGLKKLYEAYASDDVLFVTITFDNVSSFIETNRLVTVQSEYIQSMYDMRFKIISIDGDEIGRRFRINGYPTNFLVGINGNIVKMKRGIKSFDTATQELLAEFLPAIQSELQKIAYLKEARERLLLGDKWLQKLKSEK